MKLILLPSHHPTQPRTVIPIHIHNLFIAYSLDKHQLTGAYFKTKPQTLAKLARNKSVGIPVTSDYYTT